jgi:hypothetical protein
MDDNVNIKSQIVNTINNDLIEKVISMTDEYQPYKEEFLYLTNIFIYFSAVKDAISYEYNEKIFKYIALLVEQIIVDENGGDL